MSPPKISPMTRIAIGSKSQSFTSPPPRLLAKRQEGEDVYWVTQDGGTDSSAALQNHLHINQLSEVSHLFTYCTGHTVHPLTKMKFLESVEEAAHTAGLKPLQGHGICIGSTLKYLLWGVPFNVMKAKGCWASNSFQLYLWKHAVVITPYIQATPTFHKDFICYTMPQVY